MDTIKRFVNRHHIKIESDLVEANPNMIPDDNWQAHHFKVVLRGNFNGKRRQLTTYFSMGMAHTGEPEAEDVISCLASDAASVENASNFERWAWDLGYDLDSRKAEQTYKACQRGAKQLERFCSTLKIYNGLLFETEQL